MNNKIFEKINRAVVICNMCAFEAGIIGINILRDNIMLCIMDKHRNNIPANANVYTHPATQEERTQITCKQNQNIYNPTPKNTHTYTVYKLDVVYFVSICNITLQLSKRLILYTCYIANETHG